MAAVVIITPLGRWNWLLLAGVILGLCRIDTSSGPGSLFVALIFQPPLTGWSVEASIQWMWLVARVPTVWFSCAWFCWDISSWFFVWEILAIRYPDRVLVSYICVVPSLTFHLVISSGSSLSNLSCRTFSSFSSSSDMKNIIWQTMPFFHTVYCGWAWQMWMF